MAVGGGSIPQVKSAIVYHVPRDARAPTGAGVLSDEREEFVLPYRITWEPTGAHLFFFGNVTGAEIRAAGDEAYGNERFDASRHLIFDFVEAEQVTMTVDDVRLLAAIDQAAAQTNPRIRQAIVSDSETIDTALSLYGSSAPDLPLESRGFRSLAEARSWLESP